jgi:hypothetical protein
MHMLGAHNPQSNKLTREVFLPTRSTLDLSSENSPEYDAFMLAIAQHVGDHMGIKVHKQPRAKSVADIKAKLDNELAPALELIHDWLSRNGTKKPLSLNAQDIGILKDALGSPTPAAIHSLIEYARYLDLKASSSPDLSKFTTSLYLEADGVTDGPINSLIHMTVGRFTPEWVGKVAKGGLFFGGTRISINDYIQSDAEGANVDLYKTATIALKRILTDLELSIENPAIKAHYNDLITVMTGLLPDMNFNEQGELVIERGMTKNPLTITIYGSGAKGIAGKISRALTDAYYEQISEGRSLNPKVANAFEKLFFNVVAKNKKGEQFILNKRDTKVRTGRGVTETLHPNMIENLEQNLLGLFVKPMVAAIGETIGETETATNSIMKATQLQSIFMKYAFQAEVQRVLEEKRKSEGRTDIEFLTRDELGAIQKKLLLNNPLVDTGTQEFFMAASSNADVGLRTKKGERRDVIFARSLDGSLGVPARTFGPDNAGVRGIPTTIIGAGDGQAMQNVFTMPGAPEGAMQVFDGLNMKLSTINKDSQKMNEAVHRAWLRTPFRAVFESYQDFVSKQNFSEMDMPPEMLSEIAETIIRDDRIKTIPKDRVIEMVQNHLSEMEMLNRSLQARRNVLARVNMSVDHMASAESPYVKDDGINLLGSPAEIADQLNELYKEEFEKLAPKVSDEKKKETPKPDNSKAKAFLAALGPKDSTGATIIKIGNIRNRMRDFVRFMVSPDDLEIIRRAVNSKQVAGYRVIYGTREQTDAYLAKNGLSLSYEDGDYIGSTLHDEKLIVLNTDNPETLVHELIHASTMEKVLGYYTDPSSLNQEEKDAVQRLEILMSEWMEVIEDGRYLDIQETVNAQTALDQINKHLYSSKFSPEVNKAMALNEFMARVLSNEYLRQQASETKVKSPLVRILGDVLKALKQLLFGKHKVPEIGKIGDDLLSNVRFNSLVLMKGKPSLKTAMAQLASFQAAGFGTNERLSQLRERIQDKITALTPDNPDPAVLSGTRNKINRALAAASAITDQFMSKGFRMDMQERSTFSQMVSMLMTEAQLDPNALIRIQDLYTHVTKNLSVESFMADPDSQDPNHRYLAQEQFNALMGVNTVIKDELGRTSLMASFLALANVHEGFREILRNMEVPKVGLQKGETLDQTLDNLGDTALDNLSRWMSGEKRNSKNVKEAIDSLTFKMMENVQDQNSYIDQFVSPVGNAIDKANKFIVDAADRFLGQATDKLEKASDNAKNKATKAALLMASQITSLVNEERSDRVAASIISTMNKMKIAEPIYDLVNEMIGRTEDNKSIFDLIKISRADVQQTRQEFREDVPKIIASKFSRKLTKDEWTDLFKGMAKTDLAALSEGMSPAQVIKMLEDPSLVQKRISDLEEQIRSSNSRDASLIIKKAKELAEFMNTGKVSGNLLRNARAIAMLMGEKLRTRNAPKPSDQLISLIDQLTSLYAVDGLNAGTKEIMVSLAQTEAEGMRFTFDYLQGQRRGELDKVGQTDMARLNHYKGYIHTENQGGQALTVVPDSDHAKMAEMGFIRLGSYEGSNAETGISMSYYYSPISGRAVFHQGIIQNVRATAYGVDPVTGFSLGSMTAGRITNPRQVAMINKRFKSNAGSTEPLMPIYDLDGDVIAYERSIDPAQEARLDKNTNLSQVIAMWRGRQVEEAKSQMFNQGVINNLWEVWDKAGADIKDEFIDLTNTKALDPVVRDAVALITPETRAYIRRVFGTDGFMVRKDMLYDAIGYRAPSVTDAWTGNTRWSPEVQDATKKLAIGIMGNNAYRYMAKAERFYQGFVC